MKLPPYPQYKNSGTDWLGELPRHWQVKQVRHLFQNLDHRRIPLAGEDRASLDKLYPYYGASGIIDYVDNYLFDERLILVAEDGANLLSRSTPLAFLASGKYWVNNHAHILRPKHGDIEYWVGALQIFDYTPLITGAAQPKLTGDRLNSIALPCPPEEEQTRIASFLREKTVHLDTLISKKQALVERLKEKRTALISRTVTRGLPPDAARAAGLDPNPKLKPSGIDWLGDVPEHWESVRLKHVIERLYSGVSVNSDVLPAEEGALGILKTSCVYGDRFRPGENKRVLDEEVDRLACPATSNSIIISRMNTPELVGACGFVDRDHPTLYLPDRLWIARFSEHSRADTKFMWRLLTSKGLKEMMSSLATGTSGSMKNLAQDDFLNIGIALPPKAEQQAIAAFVDRETSMIDQMLDKVALAIDRLQEYRTALITAAVTGKIDVRGVSP